MLFQRLLQESETHLKQYADLPFIAAVRDGAVTKDRYKTFLNDLYHVVWHFCPTMAAGASRCSDDFAGVRYALYEHINEEKGHEEWVLNDCRAIDGNLFATLVKNGKPRPEIQALNAYNYHVVDRQHGAAALAMIFTLEVISQQFGGRVSAGVAKALGLEGDHGTTFLSSHGPMDGDHLEKMSVVIDSIFDDEVANILSNAIAVNFKLFAAILS